MDFRTRVALIGLGSDSRRDDGVGRAVVDALREHAVERPLSPEVGLETCNGNPAQLIGLWHDADLAVVVTCAYAYPGEPGRVVRREFDAQGLALPLRGEPHGTVDNPVLVEAVELSRMLGRLPGRLVVYAVQGADSSLGSGLSRTLADMVEPLADRVRREVVRGSAPPVPARPVRR
ncbi:peptidase M52 [Streptomyces spongiicola]|uniref:Peptidase M52 n=1 Tax=Streptomyces spongiicola TaxID=1690221 RepID=A0A388SUK3_9ACTN|nr:hydrogenase maturation protease [Streptomyces spongiicola]GBP99531.1 peptidase M52 [Streptomyces spongiicola]